MKNRYKIESIEDGHLDPYVRLTSAQLRSKLEPEKGVLIAEAQTVIEVALDEGCFPLSALIDETLLGERTERVIARCEERNPAFETYIADKSLMRRLTGFELTRGMLCAMRRPQEKDARALIESARSAALLEGVADSTNIGAILRCAAGIGIDAVLLTKSCCDPYLRRAVRVSMGTVFKTNWAYVEDARQAIDLLRENGFTTIAMALTKDALPIDDRVFSGIQKRALFLGTEGDGLKKETIEACDHAAIIPMKNGVDSLNVAAAAAVAFWALGRE